VAPVEVEDRTGVLVLRAWVECAGPRGFRARITFTADIDEGSEQVEVVASPKAAIAVVSRWLREIAGDVAPP
jgi:hypothetical protein